MLDLATAATTANRHWNAVITFPRVFLLVKGLLAGRKLRLGLHDLLFNLFKRLAQDFASARHGAYCIRSSQTAALVVRHAIKCRMNVLPQFTEILKLLPLLVDLESMCFQLVLTNRHLPQPLSHLCGKTEEAIRVTSSSSLYATIAARTAE